MAKLRRVLSALALLAALFVPCILVTAQQPSPATRQPLNRNPEPYFTPNLATPLQDLANPDSFLDYEGVAREGGRIASVELTTFGEFCRSIGREPYLKHVSPDRKVWIVKILWPQGFRDNRRGVIPNCVSVTINDAETGAYMGAILDSADSPKLLPWQYISGGISD